MGGKRAIDNINNKGSSGHKLGIAKQITTEEEIFQAAEYSLVTRRVGDFKAFKSSLSYLILPSITLALGQIAGIAGIVRSSMIEALVLFEPKP